MNSTNDKRIKPSVDSAKSRLNKSFKKPATFFLIIAAVILLMSIFFKIGSITVEGNSIYKDKEIIDASGIQKGDNLFFINRIAAGSRVVVKLPYVDAVTITRGLPNRITITVSESVAVAYVNVNGELWSVGGTGKCLGTLDKTEAAYMGEITGINITQAEVGETIVPENADKEKCAYLLDVLEQIQSRGLAPKVSAIDMSDADNPVIEYDDRFTVKLGAYGNTEYKFGKFIAAVEQIGDKGTGILDVSQDNKVEFNPN